MLNNILSNENTCNDIMTLLGDININIVGINSIDNDYLNMLSLHDFKSFINVYTRTPNHFRHSCIDHIFVKFNSMINNFEAGVIQTSITDHFLTVLAIPINVNSKSKRNTNNIKKIEIINHEKVNIILKSEQWEDVYSNNDINRSCDIFYDKINNAISLATTIKNVGSRYKRIKEWMTAGLLCSARKKQYLSMKN